MCMDFEKTCACGRTSASFMFRDEIMPVEVVEKLYCPHCSEETAFEPSSMIRDNGWMIKYDMEVANLMGGKLPRLRITPETLFDEGYCTWRGVYPGDHRDSCSEREELSRMAKVNPRQYVEEFKRWGIDRMERLTREGWRKANESP